MRQESQIKCPLCRGQWQFYPVGPFRRDTIYVDPYRVSVGPPLRPLSDPELKILELEMKLYREKKLRLEVAKVRDQYWRRAEAAEKRVGILAGLRRLLGTTMVLLLTACLLTACGGEPEVTSQVRTCTELAGSVESDSFCLSQFECRPGDPKFHGHMCLCWESLCLCFVSRSTEPCGAPEDAECATESSMLMLGPGVCARSAQSRDAFLGGEYDRLLGDWEGERHAVRE